MVVTDYILPILGIVIPTAVVIIIYFLQIKKKSLAYRILSVEEILTHSFKQEKMVIKINDKEVVDPIIVNVKIINNGKVPILDSDFVEQDFAICCPTSSIIGYSVIEKSPEVLNIEDGIDDSQGNALVINPLLLNQGDYFTYKLLIDGFDRAKFKVSARIKGVKEIIEIKNNKVFESRFTKLIFMIAMLFVLISVLFLIQKLLSMIIPGWSLLIVFVLFLVATEYLKQRFDSER